MNKDWSREEVEVIISDYLAMLQLELLGKPYNKSEHRRSIMPLLENRSDRSIDSKHCNISAVLIQLGRTYISGYKPYWNYQKLLREVIIDRIDEVESLDSLMDRYSRQNIEIDPSKIAYHKLIVEAPKPQKLFKEPIETYHLIRRNYIEEEQRNKSIGDSGEQLVLNYERWRLNNEGKFSLAKKIEWVSKEQGDGAGFDILSKNIDGSDRFIEVKSTTLGKETPIFFSKRENDFSESNSGQFHLYRIFELKKTPKMFQFNGSFSSFCGQIESMTFKGHF